MEKATAIAPTTVANVIVGFDMLGFAVPLLHDRVTVRKISEGVVIESVHGASLPMDAKNNTAGLGLLQLIDDLSLDFGFGVSIEKGIPLGSGLGGSAASAVASVVAANALLDEPLSKHQLLKYALIGESVASGGSLHGDNVAASLYGGLTLYLNKNEVPEVVSLPIPDVTCLIIHPSQEIETRSARAILQPTISMKDFVGQSMRLAAFISGCFTGDLDLIGRYFEDIVIEKQRSHLIHAFEDLKNKFQHPDVLGFSIAGAGPSMFAWLKSNETAESLKEHVLELGHDAWVTRITAEGATLTD